LMIVLVVTVRVTEVVCVGEVPVPVTVSEYVPGAAVPVFTVSVELPPAVTDVGLSAAVAPLGTPVTERLTVCALPEVTAVEIVLVPEAPCTRLKLVGLAAIEKLFGGLTVSVTEVVCVAEVPVPVTVSVYVPAAAVPVFTVSVELPPAVTDVGLSDAVAPLGTPVTERLTVCALPEVTAVEIVLVPEAPCTRLKLVGLAAIEKLLVGEGPQPGNLNDPMRVLQLNAPFEGMYSFVYQNVQSSTGSTLMLL